MHKNYIVPPFKKNRLLGDFSVVPENWYDQALNLVESGDLDAAGIF